MIGKETIKVILASSLLFFMCYMARIHNDYTSNEWIYPHYDASSDSFSINPSETFSEPYKWFLKTTFDKIAPLILALVFIIKPDFNKWGVNLMWIWVFYFFLLTLNYVLTYDTLNIISWLNKVLLIAQLVYCFDYGLSDEG